MEKYPRVREEDQGGELLQKKFAQKYFNSYPLKWTGSFSLT